MTEIDLYDSPQAGKDYVLEVRIRNGPLLRALRARGFQSAMAFAEATKFSYSTLCSYLGLRRAPISKTGHWHDSALVLAKLLHLPPDSLFPEQHLEQALSRSRGEVEVSREELCLMLAGPTDDSDAEHELERQQVHGRLQDLMYGCLRPREMRVLAGRFGFDADGAKTLDELADEMGVGRERIRQIEAVALRRLGARANRRKLESAGGYGFVVARAATSKLSDRKFVVGTKKALVAALQQNHIRKKNISSLFGEHAGELTLAVRRHGNGSTVCLIQAERIRVCVAIAQSVGIQVLGYKDPVDEPLPPDEATEWVRPYGNEESPPPPVEMPVPPPARVDAGPKLPNTACTNCGAEFNRFSYSRIPRPGDVTICHGCGHLMVFGEDMLLRNLNRVEAMRLIADPNVRAAQRAIFRKRSTA